MRNMKLNQAVSKRLSELLDERNMTQYQLYMKSGVPKSTIGNIINCSYDSVKLRVIHELCQGLSMDLPNFFASPLFSGRESRTVNPSGICRRGLISYDIS